MSEVRELPDKNHSDRIDEYYTFGEGGFDIITYGGFALAGNELLSGRIGDKLTKPKGQWHSFYNKGMGALHSLFGKGDEFKAGNKNKWIAEGCYMFALTLGGHLMAIPVKLLEDVKKPIVKWIDAQHYGKEAKTDPKIIAAHKELDAEPEKTWGSIAQSRGVTVVSAVASQYVICSTDALSTKPFKDTVFEKWSSLDRIITQIVRWAEGLFYPAKKDIIASYAKASPFTIQDCESNFAQKGKTYGFILAVSGVLTCLFYYCNKFFAEKHDKKVKQHEREEQLHGVHAVAGSTLNNVTAAHVEPSNQPVPKVSKIDEAAQGLKNAAMDKELAFR
jgi:hypothetical protein